MIPDALKPAICSDESHLMWNSETQWTRWNPNPDCPSCGGSGLNPDMIRKAIEVDDDYAMRAYGTIVNGPGCYVVIGPLKETQ
jgi:hypothetical protein